MERDLAPELCPSDELNVTLGDRQSRIDACRIDVIWSLELHSLQGVRLDFGGDDPVHLVHLGSGVFYLLCGIYFLYKEFPLS